jgi:hypothetical protein
MSTIRQTNITNSSDPNATSGRAANSQKVFKFPESESLTVATRLRFTAYSRFGPETGATESTTAIITLPLPSQLRDNSDIDTGNADMGALGTVDFSPLNNAIDASSLDPIKRAAELGISIIGDSIKTMGDSFKISALKGLALNPLLPDSRNGTKQSLQLVAGVVQNPHTNLIFNGINIKKHTLSWRLSPRSQQESDTLNDIIRTIKTRIHPAESFKGYALDYPDLIHITFTGGSDKYLPMMRKGMVTGFEVVMNSGDGPTLYTSLAPIMYNLTLSYQEVDIVTRDVLEEAYANGESAEIIT